MSDKSSHKLTHKKLTPFAKLKQTKKSYTYLQPLSIKSLHRLPKELKNRLSETKGKENPLVCLKHTQNVVESIDLQVLLTIPSHHHIVINAKYLSFHSFILLYYFQFEYSFILLLLFVVEEQLQSIYLSRLMMI